MIGVKQAKAYFETFFKCFIVLMCVGNCSNMRYDAFAVVMNVQKCEFVHSAQVAVFG